MLDKQIKLFIHHYHQYQKKNQNVLWDLMVDHYMNRFIWIGESMKTRGNMKIQGLDLHHILPIIIISMMMVLLQYLYDDLWTIAVYIVFNIYDFYHLNIYIWLLFTFWMLLTWIKKIIFSLFQYFIEFIIKT
jgi:hypothetical protein